MTDRLTPEQPTGLLCDLLAHPELAEIRSPRPTFGWIVQGAVYQTGSQILVASSPELLAQDTGDCWDSGEPLTDRGFTTDDRSISVEYEGTPLSGNTAYWWKVRVWSSAQAVSPWSEMQQFRTGTLAESPRDAVAFYPPEVTPEEPIQVVPCGVDSTFIDFGKAAFGTVVLTLYATEHKSIEVRLGEVLRSRYEIEENPGGSRRFLSLTIDTRPGCHDYQIEIPRDERNSGPMAVRMPESLFEVYPFRYCEVRGTHITRQSIHRLSVHYPFCDDAAAFHSSNSVLNDVWEFCRYSMKATSALGYYIDGDRERIPYEADAYINQLGHYAADREFSLARRTHEYLITHPTWPTEWQLFVVLVAWNDLMYSGDTRSAEAFYDDLAAKTLGDLAREDGLISTKTELVTEAVEEALHYAGKSKEFFHGSIRDLIDWPPSEQDNFDLKPVNSVVNALHYRALRCFADIAESLDRGDDATAWRARARIVKESFQRLMLDHTTHLVLDGEGSAHSSVHGNAFALAAGLVPPKYVEAVRTFLRTRGMACSVYASQILLEGVYSAGDSSYGLSLLTSTGERSWAHMVYDVGTTISLEAWDDRFKQNQDWNHAWGAAPASIIPQWLMGVRPLEPGFRTVLIEPQTGDLEYVDAVVPTIRGAIHTRVRNSAGGTFSLDIEIPGNTTAVVALPSSGDAGFSTGGQLRRRVLVDGREVAVAEGDRPMLRGLGPGRHSIVSAL